MTLVQVVSLAAAFGLSYWLTGWVRRQALAHQIIDIPNERSSHKQPTPRGGGLGFVVGFLALLPVALLGLPDAWRLWAALTGGGLLVAGVGFLDDRAHVRASVRSGVHFVAALWAVILLGGMPPLDLGFATWAWGWFGHAIAVIGIVWMINLYNFMDGIDGIAGAETLSVGLIVAVLAFTAAPNIAVVLCVLAAAVLGFLMWNWPPAKIFMGDVGSGFLGFVIATCAIASAHQGMPLWPWLILLGVFVVDTTVTLARRVLRGDKWYEAHRSHAYQHATIRYDSHLKVTVGITMINVVWLGTLALMAYQLPTFSIAFTLAALLPLGLLALRLGAGRP